MVGKLRRLFLAVPLDDGIRAMLAEHLASVPMGARPLPGTPVNPRNWHLTLRFLGHIEEIVREKITAGLDQSHLGASFEIELGEMGAFPRPARATVLWLGLTRGLERLSELNATCEEICQAAGLGPEDRPYSVHLTLSRIRPHQDVRSVVERYEPQPFGWTATEVVLFESHLGRGGAAYEPVEVFPLSSG